MLFFWSLLIRKNHREIQLAIMSIQPMIFEVPRGRCICIKGAFQMLCVCSKKYAKNKSFALYSTKECANSSFDLVQFKLYFNKYFAFITCDKKALAFRKYLSCLCFDKCLIFFFLLRCQYHFRVPFNFKRKCFKSVQAQRLKWKYKVLEQKQLMGLLQIQYIKGVVIIYMLNDQFGWRKREGEQSRTSRKLDKFSDNFTQLSLHPNQP